MIIQSGINSKMNRFLMPIGDWSDDGHGQCEHYIIETRNTLEEIREAHFNLLAKTGVNIEKLCSRRDYITVNQFDDMKQFLSEQTIKMLEAEEDVDADEDVFRVSADSMAEIWVDLLNHSGQEISLTLLPQENLDMIPFYGVDDKGRHISGVGYGILGE